VTAPARRAGPTQATIDKAGRIVAAHDDGTAPILIDVCEPAVPAFLALVPAGSRPEPYVVSYGELLGWRCDCLARGMCSHVLACMHLFDQAGEVKP
jgi:hypothetical protein